MVRATRADVAHGAPCCQWATCGQTSCGGAPPERRARRVISSPLPHLGRAQSHARERAGCPNSTSIEPEGDVQMNSRNLMLTRDFTCSSLEQLTCLRLQVLHTRPSRQPMARAPGDETGCSLPIEGQLQERFGLRQFESLPQIRVVEGRPQKDVQQFPSKTPMLASRRKVVLKRECPFIKQRPKLGVFVDREALEVNRGEHAAALSNKARCSLSTHC